MDNIESTVGDYINQNLVMSKNGATMDPDASLLETGIIDSAAMVELLLFLESEFGISIPPQEVVPENFNTVKSISGLVRSMSQVG